MGGNFHFLFKSYSNHFGITLYLLIYIMVEILIFRLKLTAVISRAIKLTLFIQSKNYWKFPLIRCNHVCYVLTSTGQIEFLYIYIYLCIYIFIFSILFEFYSFNFLTVCLIVSDVFSVSLLDHNF